MFPGEITFYWSPGLASRTSAHPPSLAFLAAQQHNTHFPPSQHCCKPLGRRLEGHCDPTLALLFDIHLKLLLGRGVVFSKEWRNLATWTPLTAEELCSFLAHCTENLPHHLWQKNPHSGLFVSRSHRGILWWHCDTSETVHHYQMVDLIKNS